MQSSDATASVTAIQEILDRYCLVQVTINPESRVSATEGPVAKELMQQGWRTFLIKVHNEAQITPQLNVGSPQAAPVYERGSGARQKPQSEQDLVTPAEAAQRFLDIEVFRKQPLKAKLSGLNVEYAIIQLYSRDVGRREATLVFDVGQGTQDLGFRSEVPILFDSVPSGRSGVERQRYRRYAHDGFVYDPAMNMAGCIRTRPAAWRPTSSFMSRCIAPTASRCICRPANTACRYRVGRNTTSTRIRLRSRRASSARRRSFRFAAGFTPRCGDGIQAIITCMRPAASTMTVRRRA